MAGTTINPYRFGGQVGYRRDGTNRNYVRARNLDTQRGRWLSNDPIGLAGKEFSLYQYASNNPANRKDPLGLISYSPAAYTCTLEEAIKLEMVAQWGTYFVTDTHWHALLLNWYGELGPNPVQFIGNADPRNQTLRANVGFTKLLECWAAVNFRAAANPVGDWSVSSSGFSWNYAAPWRENLAAGQIAAYDSATYFLGSYSVSVTPITWYGPNQMSVRIFAYNTSGWHSASRFPNHWGVIFPDHPRKRSRCTGQGFPSTGGNLVEHFIFNTITNVPCKCNLP